MRIGPHAGPISGLVLLIILCLSSGPLAWDFSRVYRGSLDHVVLVAIISTIAYIFIWIAFWLGLTLKNRWTFKLRVSVARTSVASARSIKLVNDVDLRQSLDGSTAPLLVVGGGRAYEITQDHHKNGIMNLAQKSQADAVNHKYLQGASHGESKTLKQGVPDVARLESSPSSDTDTADYALLLEDETIKAQISSSAKPSTSSKDKKNSGKKQKLIFCQKIRSRANEDDAPPLPPPPPGLGGPASPSSASQRSDSDSDTHLIQHDQHSTSSTTTNNQSDDPTRSKCTSEDDLTQLSTDPSLFPSYPRPLRSHSLYSSDSVAIRRCFL